MPLFSDRPVVSPEPGPAGPRRPPRAPRRVPPGRLRRWLAPTRVRVLLGVLAVVLAAAGAWAWSATRPALTEPAEIPYTELLAALKDGRVESVTVVPGREIRGTWRDSVAASAAAEPAAAAVAAEPADDFRVVYPVGAVDGLAERASAAGTSLSLEAAPDRDRMLQRGAMVLTLLIFLVIGYLLFRTMRGPQTAELGVAGTSDTTFADVAGTQGAAEELRELVEFLREPESFSAVGARIPKGALLVGPPGTGKTLLARAVAGEAGVPFFSVSGSEVTGFLVGMGASRIRSLFRKARKTGGVIFIDEIDALGGKRGRNRSHNEDDRTLNQLLVEMDGFSPLDGVVVVAATNRPDDLDEALKRPGRFDRIISVTAPTAQGREEILRLHAGRRKIPLHAEVDLARLARLTPGSSGAELANLLNESAIAAAREGSDQVRWSHVELARDRILLGKERKGFRALDVERVTVAYHEAGHALAGVMACPEDGLHKVTIQARGQALGVAFFSPDDDRSLHRRSYLEGQIIKGLAGRAAEELVFGTEHVTSGAASDLVNANSIARKMVYQLGMGVETGLLIHSGEYGSLSHDAHAAMDREVAALLERLYDRTRDLLREHHGALSALAVALIERETLEGSEALAVMLEAGLPHPGTLGHARPETVAAPLAGMGEAALAALRARAAISG